MQINPYITKINTQILKKLTPHGKIHLALKDRIDIDYKKFRCFEEKYEINSCPVESTYDSSLGKVYIISKNPSLNMVDLSVDHETRLRILRSFTSRYLILVALKKHMNLSCSNFRTNQNSSSFYIEGLIDQEKIKETIINLQRVIEMYIESGLNVRSLKSEDGLTCIIDGLYRGPFICPHLSNLSEIIRFNIVHYELSEKGVTIYFNN